jgi:hypothetical protein
MPRTLAKLSQTAADTASKETTSKADMIDSTIEGVTELYTQKPLTDNFRKNAEAYIQRLENRKNDWDFRNFEAQLRFYIIGRRDKLDDEYFGNSFAEFVLLEVRTKNRMKLTPRWNLPLRFLYFGKLDRVRSACYHLYGASPRYHGKIYRKFINNALIEADMYFTIPLYWGKESPRVEMEDKKGILGDAFIHKHMYAYSIVALEMTNQNGAANER